MNLFIFYLCEEELRMYFHVFVRKAKKDVIKFQYMRKYQ